MTSAKLNLRLSMTEQNLHQNKPNHSLNEHLVKDHGLDF